jgi:site-specific DNA recombinase
MIKDSQTGLFELVLIYKTDRFSRNKADSAIYKRMLLENGVKVIPVMESFIADNPFGVVMEGMLEGWAEYYSLNLSSEVKKGQNANIRKFDSVGKVKHNGGKPPFGYVVDAEGYYEIDKDEARAVKKIFEMYSQGFVYKDIVKWLNDHGYYTKYGKPFSKTALNGILSNSKYCGVYTYRNKKRVYVNGRYKDIDNPDKVVIDGGIPAIVSKDDYERIQRIMAENSKNSKRFSSKAVYALSGKVYCAICGSKLESNSYKGGRGGKHQYRTYRCSGRHKGLDCDFKPKDKEELEMNVSLQLEKDVFNVDMIESLSKDIYESYKAHSASSVDTLKAYKSKMTTLENQIANLTNALANGATFDSIYTKLAELEHQKGILEFEIKREEKSASNALSIERIKELLSQGLDMHLKSDKEKATLINTFVESIAVGHDDELKVRLNFKTDRDVDAGGEGYSFLSLSS